MVEQMMLRKVGPKIMGGNFIKLGMTPSPEDSLHMSTGLGLNPNIHKYLVVHTVI